ncbi:cilia- and flagella-associated protein 107 isoform X3 [Austrofundulus limnaeus]|uniref:Cilia- and flagella-associated protein 107 isoform X3 n=1 Tax=Austrofundulus limnaeus TaxID=52670 RepID=A0A2I4BBE9_AUSLI|nr:PREDICTED: uncharacterized protein C1orf158 homolog isoform X3 [Austrofundulus limnaeus]
MATEDKWSQTGWKIEQQYGNKVLLGNWAEDRLQFTREQKIANSSSRVDYRPHWDFKPDILKRRSAVLRAEGLPYMMLFGHHRPPPSHYLATEYKQSYAERHNNSLPAVQPREPDDFTCDPEKSNHPHFALSSNSGPMKSTNHSCEKLQSQLPALSVYQSTYHSHPLGALCKSRFARASRTLSSCLYTTNHINKDLNLRQRLHLQVPDHCFSQDAITKQP